MQIKSLLSLSRTVCGVEASSKRQALEIIANTIAQDLPGLDAGELLRRFLARERLGSTGVGHGIAIPHCRIQECKSAVGALVTLKRPVDFDAIDTAPVDILFAMIVPESAHDEHLRNLAALATALNNDQLRANLRAATDTSALYNSAINT